tara:strand:+ start:70 stop:1290 length:1221 start_codon:yes stop_codon:yes gene_type:complete
MKKKKIIFLSAFLHSGVDWVHSLLDSHPQVLITPALSFYRCWIRFNFNEFEKGQKIYNEFYKYIKNNIGPNSKNEQKIFLHSHEELNNFFLKFSDLLKNSLISRKDAFLHIHESYLYAKKIETDCVKVIIAHEHLPFYKNLFKNDFPESSLILVLRDPRAALAGIWYRRTKLFGHLPDYTFNMTMDCWFYATNILKDKFYKQKDNLYLLKNEALHNDLRNEMKKLAIWLKINFNDSLLIESFASGKKVFIDSAYLLSGKPNDQVLLNQEVPNNYFKIENVTARWKSVLSRQQIIMVEGIFSAFFKKFGYKKIYNDNLYNKILSIVFFIIPQKALLNYWVDNYPNIDAFGRVYERLNLQKKTFSAKIWILLPNFTKFLSLILYSSFSRIKIFLSSKEKIPSYDIIKK